MAGIVVGILSLLMLLGVFFVCCGGCAYIVGKVSTAQDRPTQAAPASKASDASK
jgi:hypothetical protein